MRQALQGQDYSIPEISAYARTSLSPRRRDSIRPPGGAIGTDGCAETRVFDQGSELLGIEAAEDRTELRERTEHGDDSRMPEPQARGAAPRVPGRHDQLSRSKSRAGKLATAA